MSLNLGDFFTFRPSATLCILLTQYGYLNERNSIVNRPHKGKNNCSSRENVAKSNCNAMEFMELQTDKNIIVCVFFFHIIFEMVRVVSSLAFSRLENFVFRFKINSDQ